MTRTYVAQNAAEVSVWFEMVRSGRILREDNYVFCHRYHALLPGCHHLRKPLSRRRRRRYLDRRRH
jgi:hypothetical protein